MAYILNYTLEEALHFYHLAAYAVYYEVLECVLWCGENCFMSSYEIDIDHISHLLRSGRGTNDSVDQV